MIAPSDAAGGTAGPRPDSPRVRLARVASDAALSCDGVAALDAGPREHWCTWAGRERLPGVVVIADDAPGRYATSVYLKAHLTDLRVVSRDVQDAIRGAAADADLDGHLGEIRVAFTDIDDGGVAA